ncbi:MAG TPA: cytochrome c biogenesis protein CcdA, partial [Bdellovibrionales bacterium]|nr:cytochrome c biogenesis protein CcdA [Bdellovibrionales bacterium]
ANSANRSRTKSLTLSITYVLGIAVTYAIAGVIAAKTGALFGALLSNVYVVSGIATIFIVMALSMFGFYEIQAPAFVRNRLGTAQTGGGIVGAFATGLIAGIVASPCVGPVLVGVLAHVAQTQDAVLGFALLFTFAVGMGTLFIAIGLSSSVLNKLPKSGAWMEAPKFLFGVILVGMAFYYIKPIYPEWLFRVLIGVALILFGSAEGPFRHGQGLLLKEKLRKGLALALVVMGAAFVFAGTVQRLYPQGFINAEQTSTTTKLPWQPFSDDALKTAIDQKKPVIIDFYADWCAACVELEKDTFPDPRIQAQAGDFVWLKVDATEESAELDRVRKIYEVVGLPTMIFYDKNGQIRKDLTLTGFEKADLFLKRMEAIR